MRINNNITAINSHRNYTINQSGIGKNVEKLSSGYRINRAGDDAAGLAISEKMRAQIRGLSMASKNSQDAISLVQTAEGALQSSHNILQRMRELAVQSASDTNETTIDRAALQQEFSALMAEIDDTAGKTKFNDQSLIDGTFAKKITTATSVATGVNFAWASDNASTSVYGVTFSTIVSKETIAVASGTSVSTAKFTGATSHGSISVTFSAAQGTVEGEKNNGVWNIILSDGKVVAENQRTGERISAELGSITAGASMTVTLGELGSITIQNNGTQVIDADDFQSLTGQISVSGAVDARKAEYKHVATINDGEQIVVETGQTMLNFKNSGVSVQLRDALVADTLTSAAIKVSISTAGAGSIGSTLTVNVATGNGKNLVIQSGANEGDRVSINLAKLDAYSLGISGANIGNRMDASVAITQVNTALNGVSTQRATLGALQNRLEAKIANLDIGAENLQAAESRIRDVDMAKEMTAFTKNNILFQASTAMLAQANALPQGVLQLLG